MGILSWNILTTLLIIKIRIKYFIVFVTSDIFVIYATELLVVFSNTVTNICIITIK